MSNQLFERAVRDWLEDGSDRTPDTAVKAVLLAVKTTPQERDLRIPRRFNQMPSFMRLSAAIAVVAIVGVGAIAYIGQRPGVGSVTVPSPSLLPASPRPTAATTPASTTPTLSQTFESAVHGFAISYPANWSSLSATAARSPDEWEQDRGPDDIYDYLRAPGAVGPDDLPGNASYVLRITSLPVPDVRSIDDWISRHVSGGGPPCFPEALPSISIDGFAGHVRDSCNEIEATIVAGDRIYVLTLFVNQDVGRGRGMFDALAATIQLTPETAAS